jgi:hypothetical protein
VKSSTRLAHEDVDEAAVQNPVHLVIPLLTARLEAPAIASRALVHGQDGTAPFLTPAEPAPRIHAGNGITRRRATRRRSRTSRPPRVPPP